MSCRRRCRQYPVDRAALPHPAQQVDVLPSWRVQFADKAARIHDRDDRRGHVSRLHPGQPPPNPVSTTMRSTSSWPGVDGTITWMHTRCPRPRCGRTAHRPAVAMRRWGAPAACPRPSACVASAQPIQIMRRGPGHRPGQAGLAETLGRAQPRAWRGVGTRRSFIAVTLSALRPSGQTSCSRRNDVVRDKHWGVLAWRAGWWLPLGGAVGDQAGDGQVGLVEVVAASEEPLEDAPLLVLGVGMLNAAPF